MAIIAVLALVGGTWALGALTSADPEPETVAARASTTSTPIEELERPLDLENFSVDQIAIGEPLEWERAAGIDGVFARQMVSHEGALYLFGSFQDWWDPGPAATIVFRSVHGRNWESLGTVLETEHPLGPVVSTPQGMIGIVEGESDFTLWRSDDGVAWQSELVEVDESLPHSIINTGALAANEEGTVLSVNRQVDVGELIRERLRAAGANFDLSQLGWGQSYVDKEVRLIVTGPLGIQLMQLTAEDIGLTDQQIDELITGGGETEVSLWIGRDGHKWETRAMPGVSWIESLTFDGQRLLAIGDTRTGRSTWASEDGGLSWTEIRMTNGDPYNVTRWGKRYVGLELGPGVDVRVSDDGSTWEAMGIDEHFPHRFDWSGWGLTAAEGGIAFLADGNRDLGGAEPTAPSVLTDDDATLRINSSSGNIELFSDGETFIWGMWSDQPQDGIEVDLEAGQIHFRHPETGERLASFGIDELGEAERGFGQLPETSDEHFQALVFSSDGESWTIQDTETDFGESMRVLSLTVTNETVVALVLSWRNVYESEPGFEIWTAPIP